MVDVAKCAKKAHQEGTTLKEATVELGLLDPKTFDELVRPELMLYRQSSHLNHVDGETDFAVFFFAADEDPNEVKK